ncbi:glycosyl transferase group 1 [Roridomyces roridus]|uniref:Glycosyl transferase group 1 n=1 Tax=Roridomyces roridus TaxID=1738132 RepID=A0AAD7FHI4_9AGAR|nr:glycosyl transferase group 1 [Roridomyces roridus]
MGGKLRVAIITENFLPKIDGVTLTLARLLEDLHTRGVETILLGPKSELKEYAGCRLYGAPGIPFSTYPGLKINFLPPSFLHQLRQFNPDVIHIVDPICLGIQSLVCVKIFFPDVPLVTSQDTNIPTYAAVFGFPYFLRRCWAVSRYVHSLAQITLVPSPSTARVLEAKGFTSLRACSRGVDLGLFDPTLRTQSLRKDWGLDARDLVILAPGRLSPEKNLAFLVESVSLLPPDIASRIVLVFVGMGPMTAELQDLCFKQNLRARFLGQITGEALGRAFASADIMCTPSYTETFGQVTLEAMASGLPVVGLHAEGTCDLVTHLHTGLLLDVHRASDVQWHSNDPILDTTDRIATYANAAKIFLPDMETRRILVQRYAALLELLIRDSRLRAQMGGAALTVARDYTWERCTASMVSAYEDVVRSRRARTPALSIGPCLDWLVVLLSVVVAGLTQVSYLIPTAADLGL